MPMMVGADTETHTFETGWMTPRMVCLSLATANCSSPELDEVVGKAVHERQLERHVLHRELPAGSKGYGCYLLDRKAAKVIWPRLLGVGCDFVFHNAAFDMRVLINEMPDLVKTAHERFDRGKIWDTAIREKLMANATGHLALRVDPFTGKWTGNDLYKLATLVMRYFGVDLRDDKVDPEAWRLRYSELDGVPLARWPDRAIDYAMLDAVWPILILEEQDRALPKVVEGFETRCMLDDRHSPPLDGRRKGIQHFAGEGHVTRGAMAHSSSASWGLRTLEEYVDHTIEEWGKKHHEGMVIGVEHGFVRPPAPTKDNERLRQLIADAHGVPVEGDPKNPLYGASGKLRITAKACRECPDPDLQAYGNAKKDEQVAIGIQMGFVKMKSSKIEKAIRERVAKALDLPLTVDPDDCEGDEDYYSAKTGQIRIAREVLEVSGDPILMEYAESLASTTYLTKFADMLKTAANHPLTYGVDPFKATGRISLFKPPYHQPPRFGGFRECHVPRPGWVFVQADYDQVELRALAQIHHWWELGEGLRDMFLEGIDPHSVMAIDILLAEMHANPYNDDGDGDALWSYKLFRECLAGKHGGAWRKVAKAYRHLAKAANFGLPGGLGARTFIKYAHSIGVRGLTLPRGELVKEVWKERYPENVAYLREINAMLGRNKRMTVALPHTAIVRGGCSYTSGANTFFQSLTAAGFNHTAWLLHKEMYADHGTALFGCRVVLPLHDEFILEAPLDQAPEAAKRLEEVMVMGMQAHIPDVPITTEAALTSRWSKDAEAVHDANGNLLVWSPEDMAA